MKDEQDYDLLIVGAGINGAGIARDAAGRGLRVLICDQGDLGNYTSSSSTKLVHGGLRYLEYYEFRLVRKALKEREVLLDIAPHVIWPLRFVMPHVRELRPAWMIRLGLFLYDNLGGREKLPGSRGIDLSVHEAGAVLDDELTKGFAYSDCWVQDSRLVVLNCQDAETRGATVLPRYRCTNAVRGDDAWQATLESTRDGSHRTINAKAIVNAAGPWVSRFLDGAAKVDDGRKVHLVKGSHIVTRKLFDHDYAYIFQHTDGRIVFAIPYEGDFTLIGTTDVAYEGDPASVRASAEEIDYLCAAVSRYFKKPVTSADVVWTYSGVRALYDEDDTENASALSRDYLLELDSKGAPLLSVFGGKITTYRTLASEAMTHLSHVMPVSDREWTGEAPLPGGDIPHGDFDRYLAATQQEYAELPPALVARLTRNYGTRIRELLAGVARVDDLGEHFGADLFEVELRFLQDCEWAMTAEDVVWRRSKLGLHLTPAQVERIDVWLGKNNEVSDDQAPSMASV
ncbi:glycerol-3-phosphate dehydrogenase [Salinisphaera aquimarina]|uniref:Glycerol-3-phosphate dehydrogenase n=1 Tax=Salinisphaera aquimarina TaxID=2094031 RepID=A0ABV7ETM5_9GAMM